jgi:acyl carrier protein
MREETVSRMKNVIALSHQLPSENISMESTFEELGIDSFDGVNLLFALEEEFDINIPNEARNAKTIRSLVKVIDRLLSQKEWQHSKEGSPKQ